MTFALILLYIEACWLGSAPSNTLLMRCAKKLNMSQSQSTLGFLYLTSVV